MQSNPNQARKRSEAAKKAARTRAAQKHAAEVYEQRRDDLDNQLALGALIIRCERVGIGWMLNHDPHNVTSEHRYELRIFEGPARAIYHGRTATHAATKAMAALDEHKVGWAT